MQDEASNRSSAAPVTEGASILRLGPFRVSAARGDIEAFRSETGWPETGSPVRGLPQQLQVPHTFPMRWLTTPEIKCVLETKVKDAGGVAIHESQSFVYENPLDPDQDYLMTADLAYQTNPQRMILTASVVTPSEVLCLQMVTILRIITAAETVP